MSDLGGGEALSVELRAEIGAFLENLKQGEQGFKDTVGGIRGAAETDGAATGGVFDRLAGDMGTKLMAGAAVVGGVALKIGQDWNNMSKEMSVQTGATGAALDGLMGSVQNVAGTVKASMGDIGDVISDVATKTHLTGPPLEELSRRFLELQDLGIKLAAGPVTATLAGWGVAAQDMAAKLDEIFRAAQVVGVPMATITDRLTSMRPALQGMGFDLNQSTLLVGRLSDQTLPGFNRALIAITKAHADQAGAAKDVAAAQKEYDAAVRTSGASSTQATEAAAKLKEAQLMLALGTQAPKDAFATLVGSIKGAANEQDALAIGMAAFGAKAAVPMTAAIRAGKFDLDGLTAGMAANTNTIHGTAQAHLTLIDRLGMLKDHMVALAGPVAQQASLFAGIIGGVKPAVEGIQSVIGWINRIKAAREASAVATGIETAATAASTGPSLAAGAAAGTASGGFFAFAAGVWAAIAPFALIIAGLVLVGIAVYELYQHWDEVWGFVKGIVKAAVGFVKEHLDLFIMIIAAPIAPLLLLWKHWDEVWSGVKSVLSGAWDVIKEIVDWIIGACHDVIEAIDSMVSKIPGGGFVGGVLGALPGFATGGTVPGPIGAPTLAVVHGGERITRPGGDPGDAGGASGGVVVIVQVAGSVLTDRDIESAVQKAIGSLRRRGAAVPVGA